MIFEVTHLIVDPARAELFEAAVRECVDLFASADGCYGMQLERFHEMLGHYYLRVVWDRLEDHTVVFKQSPAYRRWRGRVGHFFICDPRVVHTELVFN